MTSNAKSRDEGVASTASLSAGTNTASLRAAKLAIDGNSCVLSSTEAAFEARIARTLDKAMSLTATSSALSGTTTTGLASFAGNGHGIVVTSAQAAVELASAGTSDKSMAFGTTGIAATLATAVGIAPFTKLGLSGARNAATSGRTTANILECYLATMRAFTVFDVDAFALSTIGDRA